MKLTIREKIALWRKERQSPKSKWVVSIFYPICPIITEVTCADPLTALHIALRKGLKIHGFVDDNSFNLILEVFAKESEWFKISKKK